MCSHAWVRVPPLAFLHSLFLLLFTDIIILIIANLWNFKRMIRKELQSIFEHCRLNRDFDQ